jgi:segregation and condensation protein B
MRRRKGSAAESEQPVATESEGEVEGGTAGELAATNGRVEDEDELADATIEVPGGTEADASGDEPEITGGDELAPTEEEDDEAPAAAEDAPPLPAVIEGVLFASAEPVPMRRLVRLLSSWSRDEVEQAVSDLRSGLEEGDRGIRLVEAAGGLQLRSSGRLAPWVRRFFAERPPRLSRPVLETLAIIAYRQPVTRGEVEQIRGVNCDAVLGALTTRGLIRIEGRRASPGRPAEYGTTDTFLELFTLRDLAELPPLPDPTALANLVVGDSDGEADGDDFEGGSDADGGGDEATLAAPEAAASEDPESGRDGLAENGGGADPDGSGAGERRGRSGAGNEGGSDPGPDHG